MFANCNTFLVALGANDDNLIAGNAEAIRRALALIAERLGRLIVTSSIWRTPAFPAGAGPDFANAAALVESSLDPESFLVGLHEIESAMGRVRTLRWGRRVIDLDLLAMGDVLLPDRASVEHWMSLAPADQARLAPDRLILPHPRLHERAFVLVPLAEIAPDWVHPVSGKTVREMRDALDPADLAEIQPI